MMLLNTNYCEVYRNIIPNLEGNVRKAIVRKQNKMDIKLKLDMSIKKMLVL